MADYHLLSNINQYYLFYFFVTYQSILDNLEDAETNAEDRLIFHVLLDKDVNLQKVYEYEQRFNDFNADCKVAFKFNFYSVNDESLFNSFASMNKDGVISFTTYLRIVFLRFIPESVPRILYLDTDILVCTDIRNIFKQYPLKNELVYAASEPSYLMFAQDPSIEEPIYLIYSKQTEVQPLQMLVRNMLQAGVLLINVASWRNQNIEQKCFDILSKWKITYHDQDTLSIVCNGQVSYLDWEWNMSCLQFMFADFKKINFQQTSFELEQLPINGLPQSREQLIEMCQFPKIVHFAGKVKPWNFNRTITEDTSIRYRRFMPYYTKWLQIYGRLATFFKDNKH